NKLTEQVAIVPFPLSNTLELSHLNMSNTNWGGSLSTFGQDYGVDGRPLQKVFDFQTIGIAMDEAVELLRIPQPDFIKMDVDGIEHLILSGGARVLQNINSILVEINDAFELQAQEAARYLEQAGFRLVSKKHSDLLEKHPDFRGIFNQ